MIRACGGRSRLDLQDGEKIQREKPKPRATAKRPGGRYGTLEGTLERRRICV
jgi:hypothetical protein